MLTINVTMFDGDSRINGTLNGVMFNVVFEQEVYDNLVAKQAQLASIEAMDEFDQWTKDVQGILDGVVEGDVITSACKDLMFNSATGKYYISVDGNTSKAEVPEALVAVILESVDKKIDPTPIIKAWVRFLRNPNFTEDKAERFANYITSTIVDTEEMERLIDEEGYTEEKAMNRSTYNDVAITAEGLIVTKKYARLLTKGWVIDPETNQPVKEDLYKVTKTVGQFDGKVTETVAYPEFVEELTFEPPVQGRSGDAFLCGDAKDHVIKVGALHKLEEWSQVNCDDYRNCLKGLHIGGWKYVQSYKSLNCQLLECFVDPAEIGAICDLNDYSDGAMRVKEYFVYGAVAGRTKGIYHSSKYAAMKDTEWEAYKKAAIEEANALLADAVANLV